MIMILSDSSDSFAFHSFFETSAESTGKYLDDLRFWRQKTGTQHNMWELLPALTTQKEKKKR